MGAPIDRGQLALIMNDPAAIGLPANDVDRERPRAHAPEARGYVVTYRGPETGCPCCGRTNWLVGRLLAECAFCSAAVPLPERGLTLELETPVGRRHRLQPAEVRGGHRRSA